MSEGAAHDAGGPGPSPDAVGPRLLIVKLSSLGDLFHALPTVRNLKAVSGAAVDWVVQPEYAELVGCFADVDRVIPFPRRGWPRGAIRFLRELRRDRYDLVVDLQGLLKSALPARLARGRRVIGPSYSREGARLFYSTVAGRRARDRHAVGEAMDVVRRLGWPEMEPVFPVRFPRRPPGGGPQPRVALVPRSRWPTKNWPESHVIDLGRRLVEDGGVQVFLFGGPDDAALGARMERALDRSDRVRNYCGRTSLVEMGSLMQEMHLAVTVDSGPMHLAAALGVPVLALFGPTDPVRTGPYGPGHRVLRFDRLTCSPCHADRCVREDLACMRNLYPSAVCEAALAMLRRPPGPGGEG